MSMKFSSPVSRRSWFWGLTGDCIVDGLSIGSVAVFMLWTYGALLRLNLWGRVLKATGLKISSSTSGHDGFNQNHAQSPHINFQTNTNFPNTKNPVLFNYSWSLKPNFFQIFPAISLQKTDFPRQSPPKIRLPSISTPQFPKQKQIFREIQLTRAWSVSAYFNKTENFSEVFGFIDIWLSWGLGVQISQEMGNGLPRIGLLECFPIDHLQCVGTC